MASSNSRHQSAALTKKLANLNLDTRGSTKVRQVRLKRRSTPPPRFSHLAVLGFQATADQPRPDKQEIIEFPIVLIDCHQRKVIDRFHSYVRPTINPILSQFCMEYTGITQATVDAAKEFKDVLEDATQWLKKHDLIDDESKVPKFAVVVDCPYDMTVYLYMQCCLAGIPYPTWAEQWINISRHHTDFYGYKWFKNLADMTRSLGLTPEGRTHPGIDDANTLARITLVMMEDNADLCINERLPHDRDPNALRLKEIAI